MKKLYLSFLWHMHQPYYKNEPNGCYALPWVFLHGIKDYIEMVKYYEIYDIKATFNLVPSLIRQLEEYKSDNCNDLLLSLMKKNTEELTDDEKLILMPQLFMANYKNMVSPSEYYKQMWDIYHSGKYPTLSFSSREILDLEVHFLLSWTGTFIKDESSFVKSLIVKERDYHEHEKLNLIKIFQEKIGYTVSYYKKMMENGKIEVSVTPYYHPILPILLDENSALEAVPDMPLPNGRFQLKEDAEWHVSEAVKCYKDNFGKNPSGMWPAEGSISNKALELLAKNGILWAAGDEDVLNNSVAEDIKGEKRSELYKRYYMEFDGKRIYIFFRDKSLSDLLGFTYSGINADEAADDFIQRLKSIYDSVDFDPHVSVILDGENAWEFYHNNGREFFEALYSKLMKNSWISTITMSEAVKNSQLLDVKLDKITAGSWIYGNFSTWSGHEEKNKGWEFLYEARQLYDSKRSQLNNIDAAAALSELRIAEGSDWFWWYGDDHYTSQADTLDMLFRGHIINAYKYMRVPIPPDIYKPIKKVVKSGILNKPKTFISPKIDGNISSYFEYLGAGEADLKYDMSMMHTDVKIFSRMKWGFDEGFVYFAMLSDLTVYIRDGAFIELEISGDLSQKMKLEMKDGSVYNGENVIADVKINKIIELKFFRSIFVNKKIGFRFTLMNGEKIIDKSPVYGPLYFEVKDFILDNWVV